MVKARTRLVAGISAALIIVGVAGTAAPANAVTYDNTPTHDTWTFPVAGKTYTLTEDSLGGAQQTIHRGQHSYKVFSHYRVTVKSNTGHVVANVKRSLYRETYITDTFANANYKSVSAFKKNLHRALNVSFATAKAHFLKNMRLVSVDDDLESNNVAVSDYLDSLPAGTAPDFNAITPVKSSEYRGTATIYGTDATHYIVIVRDTQDGYGDFYDSSSGWGNSFQWPN